MEKKLVTLPTNEMHRPVFPEFSNGETGEFWAFLSRFVVRSGAVTLHGRWMERDKAESFARSMPCDADGKPATVGETETYWYVPSFGKVANG